MDEDLAEMTRDQLIAEVKKLRQGVREHRDSSGHELCWHHPALWGLLPEKTDPIPVVPEWPEFMRGASDTGSRWTSRRQTLRGPVSHTKSESPQRPARKRRSVIKNLHSKW